MRSISFLATMFVLLFPLTVGAIPQFLQHQGYMANNNGTPVTGSANVIFNLYTVETEGSSQWTQTIAVTFDGGYYSVLLGSGTPELSLDLFDGSDLYFATTLEGQEEFSPRTKIVSVPYAFRAEAVEGEVKAVGGLIVDGEEVVNDQQQWVGLSISFNDLADVPSDLADGDDVGLQGSGTDGTLLKFTESGVGDSVLVQSNDNIGVGVTDPQSALHVAGGLQIEDDTGDCVSGKEGTLRWHESKVEVCDGSSWEPIVSAQEVNPVAGGLQLWLDPGNSDSYPGSGTVIYDLAGNTDGTLRVHGSGQHPTASASHFSTDNGGIIETAQSGGGCITLPNPSALNFGTGDWSIQAFVRYDSFDDCGTIISQTSSYGPSGYHIWRIGCASPDSNWDFYWPSDIQGGSGMAHELSSGWYFFVTQKHGTTLEVYKNGSLQNTRSIGANSLFNLSEGPVRLGNSEWAYNSEAWPGALGTFLIYDRALSETEITANFEAYRDRYGL